MKVLIVAPDFPYPPNHGGRVDIWSRIKCWHGSGVDIDLVVTAPQDENLQFECVVKEFVRNIYYFPRVKRLDFVLRGVPYQALSRASLSHFLCREEYDFAVLESECVFPVFNSVSRKVKSVALRVHNNEQLYFKALAASENNVFKRIYYFLEANLYARYSSLVKERCDYILHISHDEYDLDSCNEVYGKKCLFVPPHVPGGVFSSAPDVDGGKVLFVGNLFTPNNISGLLWYLEKVHPKLLTCQGYEFVVAGNTKGKGFDFSGYERVRFYDSPDDLTDIYSGAAVFVNPMLAGAGVKLKTLNAIQMGLPLVTTSVGAEGIGIKNNDHFLLANSEGEFADSILFLLKNKSERMLMADRAQKYVSSSFDCSRLFDKLS